MYPYGFATVIGTRVSISLYRFGRDYDDILSRTLSIRGHKQLSQKHSLDQTGQSFYDNNSSITLFFPHSKLFNETDGYLHNETIFIEISFSDPPRLPTQSSLLFPFP